ncbi:hypothetical protein Bca101_026974 [Brassica carinata]
MFRDNKQLMVLSNLNTDFPAILSRMLFEIIYSYLSPSTENDKRDLLLKISEFPLRLMHPGLRDF